MLYADRSADRGVVPARIARLRGSRRGAGTPSPPGALGCAPDVRNAQLMISGLVMLIGLLALIAGVIYLTVKANALPSFMGTLHGYSGHRTERGTVGVIVGAVLLAGGGVGAWLAVRRTA